MKQITHLKELTGKVVKNTCFSIVEGWAILTFEDDTWVAFTIAFVEDSAWLFSNSCPTDDIQRRAGVITQEEYDQRVMEKEVARKANQEKRERRLLKQLKEKYEV